MGKVQTIPPTPAVVPAPAPIPATPEVMAMIKNLLALHGYTLAGMYRAALAFLKNYNSVQGNSMQMMQLSQAVEDHQLGAGVQLINQLTIQQGYLTDALKTYNDWIQQNPNADRTQIGDWLQTVTTTIQGQSSIINTQYSSENQFCSGMDNGINQSSADETQTESLDMQMFQQGVLTLAQQLAQAL